MTYTFGKAHTVEAFQTAVDSFKRTTGWDFMSAIHQACDEPHEAHTIAHPFEAGRVAEIPAFTPQGCPLDVFAGACYLDAWDCWLFTEEAQALLS